MKIPSVIIFIFLGGLPVTSFAGDKFSLRETCSNLLKNISRFSRAREASRSEIYQVNNIKFMTEGYWDTFIAYELARRMLAAARTEYEIRKITSRYFQLVAEAMVARLRMESRGEVLTLIFFSEKHESLDQELLDKITLWIKEYAIKGREQTDPTWPTLMQEQLDAKVRSELGLAGKRSDG